MTYSYVHRMINSEAFPTLVNLYNQDIMTGREICNGKGDYNLQQKSDGVLR